MAERDTRRVDRELVGEPHVTGRRVSVRQVHAFVEERGVDPGTVADRYDLDVADVYHVLAYYHDNPREMRDVVAASGSTSSGRSIDARTVSIAASRSATTSRISRGLSW